MTDELEQRMRAADPVPASAPVDPAGSPQAQTLVERIMTDQIIPIDAPARPGRGRWIAAAAAIAVVAIGAAVVAGGDDDGATTTLALSLPTEDPAMTMCIAPDAAILADGAEVAFEGTVTATEGDVATLTVDRWFAGDEVDQVTLASPGVETADFSGFDLEQGGHYLITAMDGAVRTCGLSGPTSPELTELFESAFG